MRRDTRSRSERIRAAIVADLEAAPYPLRLGELRRALELASIRQEVYLQAERLVRDGRLRKSGAGYQRGEAYTYELIDGSPIRESSS
jgi:hypothetical protein